jgi:pilus assembly protein CpaC
MLTGSRKPKHRAWLAWLALGFATMTLAPSPAAAQATEQSVRFDNGRRIAHTRVVVGKSQTIRIDLPFADLVVADPEVADVTPLTDRSFYVLGKQAGTTNVSIYDEQKKLVGVLELEAGANTQKLGAEMNRQMPGGNLRVASVNGRPLIAGVAPDAPSLDRAVKTAKHFSPDVMNGMRLARSQQVLLEVRFVEASRSAGRELGVNLEVVSKNFTSVSGIAGLASNNTPFGAILGTLLTNGVKADILIKALEDRGLARRLAEPNLVAMSGEKASFLAGGEFPVPVQAQLGQIFIEYKKFGVGLTFTPTVLQDGIINLRIEPEVSQLDPTSVVRTAGIAIPSLIVRRASTVVELRDGQSFAIAGLLQSVNTTTQQQLPWLGDVPVLGALFRSAAFERKETDLAIIVTPRLVKPARPGERLRTPFENTLPGNDLDFFLLGKPEVTRAAAATNDPAADVFAQTSGHILDIRNRSNHVDGR